MKLETFISLFLNINEKVNTYEIGKKPKVYYEVLHASFSEILRDLTEDQYNSLPNHLKYSIEEMEKDLLLFVTDKYKEEYEDFVAKNGKFRKSNAFRFSTKSDNQIGFKIDEDGTTI